MQNEGAALLCRKEVIWSIVRACIGGTAVEYLFVDNYLVIIY